jgi:hypothetical protein
MVFGKYFPRRMLRIPNPTVEQFLCASRTKIDMRKEMTLKSLNPADLIIARDPQLPTGASLGASESSSCAR